MKAVYKIENSKTGDFYIGSSVDYVYRKWVHIKELLDNKHHNPILQNSWNKHGADAFVFSILEEVKNGKLIEREQYYIDTLNPRYNICRVAGSPSGVKHTVQSRLNMSLAHKGKKLKPESIAKRTQTVLGVKRSDKTKDKMSLASMKYGVLQYDLDGNFIKEWTNARFAASALNLHADKIRAVCRGIRKSTGNFIWKYKTD